MRTVIALLMLLIGFGLVGYSYIGPIFTMADEVERTARSGDEAGAFARVLDFIFAGDMPHLAEHFHTGLLMIAIAIVIIIVRKKDDRDERKDLR